MGTISFLPADGADIRISGGPIENGEYVVPEEKGANAGKYRVEIRWSKKTAVWVYRRLGIYTTAAGSLGLRSTR